MSGLKIILFPDGILREKSNPVSEFGAETSGYIGRLKELLYSNKGCVGIASPQVGVLKRIVIVDVTNHKKATQKSGVLTMINPEIIFSEGTSVNREGCLSVPDFTGNVERAERIAVKYLDETGAEIKLETNGFEAVVIQHEIDHLDGIIFIDRIKNIKRDLFKRVVYSTDNQKKPSRPPEST